MSQGLSFGLLTAGWILVCAGVLAVLHFFSKGSPNLGIMQTMTIMISTCCWMFWCLAFLHQLNPLIGPELSGPSLLWLTQQWGASPVSQPTS